MPCVESGPPGLRAALSQRCPGERKTDGALSRLGGRALALARAASSRLPVWPGSTRARAWALRHCAGQWPRPDRIRCTISGFIRSQRARPRARIGNVQSVQRGAAVKVGFPIKPPDYTRGGLGVPPHQARRVRSCALGDGGTASGSSPPASAASTSAPDPAAARAASSSSSLIGSPIPSRAFASVAHSFRVAATCSHEIAAPGRGRG